MNLEELRNLYAREPFLAEFGPKLGLNPWGLDEQIRKRHANGLVESGAVVERRTKPGQQRFTCFVHAPKYAHWLTDPEGAIKAEKARRKAARQALREPTPSAAASA